MRRYPMADLDAWAKAKGLSTADLAQRIGVQPRSVHRWRQAGDVGETTADRIALDLGVLHADIWPSWADHDAELADADEARRRRVHAEAKARWRAKRSAEKREKELAYLATYRATYRDALNADRRRRYQANREAEIRAAVERKRARGRAS